MKKHDNNTHAQWSGARKSLLFSLIGVFLFFGAGVVSAAPDVTVRDEGYAARYAAQSIPDPIEIEQGETKDVVFSFKNVGTKTWDGTSGRYLSAYTMEPRYRASAFTGSNWKSDHQTAAIEGVVAPGEIGKLHLTLTANADPGEYTERFYLAAENYSWVEGGYFYVKIKVVPKTTPAPAGKTEDEDAQAQTPEGYKGKTIGVNTSSVSVRGGERVKLIVIYQNIGATRGHRIRWLPVLRLASPKSRRQHLLTQIGKMHPLWPNGKRRLHRESRCEKHFIFEPQPKKGTYTANFYVQTNGVVLDDVVSVNVHVTENAPVNYTPPSFSEESTINLPNPAVPRLDAEPRIRVGLQSVDDTQERALQFVSYEDDYRVLNGDTVEGILGKTKLGLIQYAGGVYSFKGGGLSFRTNNYIRLEPVNNPHAIFTIMNMDRSTDWAGHGKFNRYRGAVEYVRGQVDGEMYAVNDLLLEDYVKGIR